MRHFWLVLIPAVWLASSIASRALPLCAGPLEAAPARVQRVENNGAIVLVDRRVVHLEGIRLPGGALDQAPQLFADQALAAIKSMMTAQLRISAQPPKKDRYDRERAQVFVAGRWLQAELLDRGLARVEIAPDRTECAAELFAAEDKARSKHLGLWSSKAYAIQTPMTVKDGLNTFQIVEGTVLNASVKSARAYLNFGTDWRRDFTVTIDAIDMRNFRVTGVDPQSYVGQTIRVRGWVQLHNGPEIEVPNPQGIEVLK